MLLKFLLQANCKNARSVKLSMKDCEFSDNTLRKNWLSTSLSIDELTLNRCSLKEIEDDAFASPIYEKTSKIIIANNKISSLRKAMFRHLEELQELSIQENTVKSAEFNLLEEVAGSLTNLELCQAINDREVLKNITGAGELFKLKLLSLYGNVISTIDEKLFAGVSRIEALYLHDSNVATVSRDALKPIASSVLLLTLNRNRITSLPEGVLDSVISPAKHFHVYVQDNPWHCDCNLKWMQDFVEDHSGLIDNPTCNTPPMNAGKSFAVANFSCDQSSSIATIPATISNTSPRSSSEHATNRNNLTSTPRISTTTSENNNDKMIRVTCNATDTSLQTYNSRKLRSTAADVQLHPRFPNFYVSKILDTSILVNLPNLTQSVTLLWFDNGNVYNTVRCARNAKRSYLVEDIDPQTSYTICLLDDNGIFISPLNCLAVTSRPVYEARTWLTNADKTLVLSLLIASLLLLFFVGGFLSFLLIRRHPTLLRGSKRVMLVKRWNLDAIVLPKGVDANEKWRRRRSYVAKSHEDGYVTPLPPVRISRHLGSRSRRSSQSDRNSYVSPMETIETQSGLWGLEKRRSIAPPVPPHPSRAIIPSVSRPDSKYERGCEVFTI